VKDGVMVFFEPHEWCMVIDGLMKLHHARLESYGVDKSTWNDPGSEGETERLMWRIMSHVGLPDAKKTVPEAYALCYPEGPPTISGTYGKYRHEHDDNE